VPDRGGAALNPGARRVMCSESGEELLALGKALRSAARGWLLDRERLADGVRLRIQGGGEAEAAVAEFVRRERGCCPFLEFRTVRGDGGFSVDVVGPPEAAHLLDLIFRIAEPASRESR
jgi:hypothetical protein